MKNPVRTITILSFLFFVCCGTRKQNGLDPVLSGLSVISVEAKSIPLLTGYSENALVTIRIMVHDATKKKSVKAVALEFTEESSVEDISDVKVLCGLSSIPVSKYKLLGGFSAGREEITVSGSYDLKDGENQFIVMVNPDSDADLIGKLKLEKVNLILADDYVIPAEVISVPEFRFAKILRFAGQDNCDTYRIPGLITTGNGTLIAVYDNRYNSSKDLQEDINIGMSRSTDGGQTWEPMKVIMDMGEYGGLSQRHNGTGDPCILYDHIKNTIWVAALWMCGSSPDKMLWWTSNPGMSPEVTGQFVLVKSTDDGLTWSEPVSITEQIKNPAWQLLLQGPGRGITMRNGTLVFPAQFKADIGEKALDGGQYTSHSTIVYSKDGGDTWYIGTGAKSNTTEAQVVELSDGSLMLNMRDDRNRKEKGTTNGRAVAVTADLGKTWTIHPSSNKALPEPNCMASLISADLKITGTTKRVLFFSNPDNKTSRSDMTIKASIDEGLIWPADYQVKLNQEDGYGYSCLTMVDDNTVGILYEGVKDLIFQKIPVMDIIKDIK